MLLPPNPLRLRALWAPELLGRITPQTTPGPGLAAPEPALPPGGGVAWRAVLSRMAFWDL